MMEIVLTLQVWAGGWQDVRQAIGSLDEGLRLLFVYGRASRVRLAVRDASGTVYLDAYGLWGNDDATL